MIRLLLGTMFVASLAMMQDGFAAPKKAKCNPNGVAFEVIGCAHNKNVDQWTRLNKHYGHYLDSLFEKCAKEFPGGGSGGFEDRVTCVGKALEVEAKRAGFKK